RLLRSVADLARPHGARAFPQGGTPAPAAGGRRPGAVNRNDAASPAAGGGAEVDLGGGSLRNEPVGWESKGRPGGLRATVRSFSGGGAEEGTLGEFRQLLDDLYRPAAQQEALAGRVHRRASRHPGRDGRGQRGDV